MMPLGLGVASRARRLPEPSFAWKLFELILSKRADGEKASHPVGRE
jgi:hypothetical protein